MGAYPDCTEISGYLQIGDFDNSTDVTDISGLRSLTSIEEGLDIIYNVDLMTLDGLDSITTIGGRLVIGFNTSLTDLDSLENLISIGGSLGIDSNDALTDISSLGNLTSLNGHLTLDSNDGLTSLDGLHNLTSINGLLSITDNDGLTSLSSLESLTSINGTLTVRFNALLTSLSGLDNLDATTISGSGQGLTIQSNPQLSTCAIESICDYLGVDMNAANIVGNATGCESREVVEMACPLMCPMGDVILSSQAEVDAFVTAYPNCTALNGQLQIGEGSGSSTTSDITDISGLSGLVSTDGSLIVRLTESLTNLTGLDSLISIGGALNLDNNAALINLSSLNNLTSIGSALGVTNNATLMSLSGLNNIDATTITLLVIEDNPQLSACAVQSVCDYLGVDTNFASVAANATGCESREVVGMACVVSTTDISQTNIELFPNPTSGYVQLRNITVEHVDIFTSQGQRVARYDNPGQELDLSALPAGVYHLHLIAADGAYVARVVKR